MALKTLMLLLASACVTFAVLIKQCPPKESTICKCEDPIQGIYGCSQIYSQRVLVDNVRALIGYFVHTLHLNTVNASMLPTNLFQEMHIKNLDLFEVEVSEVTFRSGCSHFLGLENSLETLKIYRSFNRKLPLTNLKLDHLQSLKVVFLTENEIPEIGNDWFINGPKNLNQFTANNNGIKKLGDRAFASLENLSYLWLSHNHLKEISRLMLPSPAHGLTSLDFSFNMIRTLPADIFTGMTLSIVNFSGNLIHTLPEGTWSDVFLSLLSLDLYDNPLQCDEDLKWICNQNYQVVNAYCTEKRYNHLHDVCKQ